MLTKEDAEAEFLKLKALLKEYKAVIPIKEKNYPYLFAINYCGAQIRQNNRVYYYGNQYLELYLEGLEEKTLYVDNYLSPWSFKNIVKIGLNLKKFDWTTQFIKNYYTQLKDDFQEDAFHFNMADLFYRKQKYQESQKHLMQVQFSDVFYTLGAKSMLIKIYFETDEEEALLSLLASFTIYLKRNKKIANNIKETYLNFTSLLYQLLKAKPDKLPVVVEKIRNVELLANRKWLLNAININKSMLKPA
jgi:hypothetical protein